MRVAIGSWAVVLVGALVWGMGLDNAGGADVNIRVDAGKTRQVMEGFGATTFSLVYEGGLGDTLGPDLRKKAIDAAYGQVKLNTGNLEFGFARHADGGGWNGYQTASAENIRMKVVDLAEPLGFTDYVLSPKIRLGQGSPLLALRKSDYDRYVRTCADQVVMATKFWRERHGRVPRFVMPFNEPTSGNDELAGGGTKDVVEIVRAIGRRLREEGLNDVKLVAPCEETVARSLAVAEALLADEETRAVVGAIGYHCYPYGSAYASVPRILQHSGMGKPEPQEIELRGRLRDLGRKHRIPLWMMEVSHSEAPALSFDALRGRAIHIHDELAYADAAAYYGMNCIWDLTSHRDHFKGRGGEAKDALFTEQDTIVLVDNDKQVVHITGMGRAIGHYARWIRRGAVRMETESSDPLVQVTVFRSEESKRMVVVAMNNAGEERTLKLQATGLTFAGEVTGEQSTERAFWQPVGPIKVGGADHAAVTVPPLSVTTLAIPLAARGR